MPRNPGFDPERKAAALALAEQVGAAEAARQTGIPRGTLACWRHREGLAGPPAGSDPVEWSERKRQGAEEAWAAAQAALAEVRRLLKHGKAHAANQAALSFAILTDKSGVLELAASQSAERQAVISQAQAELVAEVIRCFLASVGIPAEPGSATLQALASLLRQAHEPGAVLVAHPGAFTRARAEIQAAVTRPGLPSGGPPDSFHPVTTPPEVPANEQVSDSPEDGQSAYQTEGGEQLERSEGPASAGFYGGPGPISGGQGHHAEPDDASPTEDGSQPQSPSVDAEEIVTGVVVNGDESVSVDETAADDHAGRIRAEVRAALDAVREKEEAASPYTFTGGPGPGSWYTAFRGVR